MKSIALVALLLFGCSKKTPPAHETGSATPPTPTTTAAGSGSGFAVAETGSAAPTGNAGPRPDRTDPLSISSGMLVVHEPAGVDNRVHLWPLFDGNPKLDWGVDKDVIEKEPFVVEMGGRAQIDTFVIDAKSIELPERMPGKIKIEVSDKSATDGFETVAELQLKQPAADNMTLHRDQSQVPGRWVRVTIFDANAEDTTQQDIANLRAYGKRLVDDAASANVTGTYSDQSRRQDHLKQNGNDGHRLPQGRKGADLRSVRRPRAAVELAR